MARNMNKYTTHHNAIKTLDEKIAAQSKVVSDLRKERELIVAKVAKGMRNSTEGLIEGNVAFRKVSTERRSATIGRVLEHAPEMADKIIETKVSTKIEVV